MKKRGKKIEFKLKGADLKKFNNAIKNFNNRVKKAFNDKKINKRSYKTLIIDKDTKDFYKRNILAKKDFNSFIKDLEKANKNTLRPKKGGKNLGMIGNQFEVSKYESDMYFKNLKKAGRFAEVTGIDYTDIAVNVKPTNYERTYKRLVGLKYQVRGIEQRYIENFKRAYRKTFNKEFEYDLTYNQYRWLVDKNPDFSISWIYDDLQETETREKRIDELVKKAQKKKFTKKQQQKMKKGKPMTEDEFQDLIDNL